MEKTVKSENTANDYLDYNEDIVIKEECFEDDDVCDDYLKENNEDTAWEDNCLERKIKTGFGLHDTSIKIENESQPVLLGVPEFILPKLHEEDVLMKTISSSYTNKNANKSADSKSAELTPKITITFIKTSSYKKGEKCKKKKKLSKKGLNEPEVTIASIKTNSYKKGEKCKKKKKLSKKGLNEKSSESLSTKNLIKRNKKQLKNTKKSKKTLNLEILSLERDPNDPEPSTNNVHAESEVTQNIKESVTIIPTDKNSTPTISEVSKKPNDGKVYFSIEEMKHYINVVQQPNNKKESQILHCSVCSYESPKVNLWRRHLQSHLYPKRFKCADCEYQTNFLSYLKEHRVTHSDQRPFKCSHCKFASKLKSNLKKHEKIHNCKKEAIKT